MISYMNWALLGIPAFQIQQQVKRPSQEQSHWLTCQCKSVSRWLCTDPDLDSCRSRAGVTVTATSPAVDKFSVSNPKCQPKTATHSRLPACFGQEIQIIILSGQLQCLLRNLSVSYFQQISSPLILEKLWTCLIFFHHVCARKPGIIQSGGWGLKNPHHRPLFKSIFDNSNHCIFSLYHFHTFLYTPSTLNPKP